MFVLLRENTEQVLELSWPPYLISTAALAEVSRASIIHILQVRSTGLEAGGGCLLSDPKQNQKPDLSWLCPEIPVSLHTLSKNINQHGLHQRLKCTIQAILLFKKKTILARNTSYK